MNKTTPPPVSDAQAAILNFLANEEKFSYHNIGSSDIASQMNFSRRSSEVPRVKSEDFSYLRKQKLIHINSEIGNGYVQITKLGIKFLNGEWEDPNAKDNDEYMKEEFTNDFEPDEVKEKEDNMTDETFEHESYGMVGISHTTGGDSVLFGCSTPQDGKVCLRVSKANLKRNLNNDWVHAKEQILELDLSYDQLLSLFFTPNRGDGTPCTLRYINNERLENPPKLENKRSQFSREFKQTLSKAYEASVSLQEEADRLLARSGQLKKPERERLKSLLNQLGNAVNSNLAFSEQQFQEQVDKSLSEAEIQLQGILASNLQTMGLEALKGKIDMPQIEQKD